MGFTFKENCSDIRNTKVEVIMNKLEKLNYKIDIFDNHANRIEFKNRYNKKLLDNTSKIKRNFYHAVVIAVKHKEIKELKLKKIKSFAVKNGLIYDLKNIFPNNNQILKF